MNDDDYIRGLMFKGFEQAFMASIQQLFMVYSAGASDPNQAERSKKGIANAVAAFRLAIEAVKNWEGFLDEA